jgi:UDP-glucose:(heptosyl)LPS alpha-1,3-glucosyltransferase
MGGRERDMAGLAQIFTARGHEVLVLSREEPPANFPPGITTHVLPARGWTNHAKLRAFNQDVTEFCRKLPNSPVLIGFDRLPGADYIYAADRPLPEQTARWSSMLPRYRALHAQERATFGADAGPFVFFLCTAQAEAYCERHGIRPDRYALLPPNFGAGRTPPSTYYAARDEVRAELNLSADAPLLVHVATNGYLKGLDRVLDLLSEVPGAVLLSIGAVERKMMRYARQKGLARRVRFLGSREDVPRLIGASDLMVHPARLENTGTVLLEALIYGVPVIASRECGYAEHIRRSGAGRVLSRPFDAAECLHHVREALQVEMLTGLKEAARRYGPVLCSEGGLQRVADSMLSVVEGRASRGPSTPRAPAERSTR